MQPAAQRRHRVRFERRVSGADAYGNAEAAWEAVATLWTGIDSRPRGRSEAVQAGRLESVFPWRVTVPRSALTIGLAANWRGVVITGPHAGLVLNIRTIEASGDGREWHLDVEVGVAT